MTRRWMARAAAFAVLAAMVGCSGGGSGNFARVSGTVMYNGNPVDGAKVVFVGTTESKGGRDEFSTSTDSNGKYVISGTGKVPGLPPGLYKVVITKLQMKAGAKVPEEGFDALQLEMSGMGTHALPKQYADASTTKLSATLEPGKNENVNFELKDDGKK
jgi:hypothetical protein